MALLRAVGIDVDGEGHGDDFRWHVRRSGRCPLLIEPTFTVAVDTDAHPSA